MTIRRVVPNLSSSRLEETSAFYREVLGFDLGMDLDWIVTLVSPSNPTAQVSISRGEDGIIEPHLTVEVDDVDEAWRKAGVRGAEIVRDIRDEDWGVRRFFVRDPSGVVLNVMTHRAPESDPPDA